MTVQQPLPDAGDHRENDTAVPPQAPPATMKDPHLDEAVPDILLNPSEPVRVPDPGPGGDVPTAFDSPGSGLPDPGGMRGRVRQKVGQVLPQGTPQRALARAALLSYRDGRELLRQVRHNFSIPDVLEPSSPSYSAWRRRHDASAAQLRDQSAEARGAKAPLRALVCVLAEAEASASGLERSLKSLLAQSWHHWSAAVCTGARGGVLPLSDERISVVRADDPVAAADEAVRRSDADFVVFLDAGDLLAPDCLYTALSAARRDPLVHLITWDDDIVDGRGRRSDPRFRPEWSPEALLGANYLAQSFAIRRGAVLAAGGLDAEAGAAFAWDLLLRSRLTEERTTRVSRVLGHVRSRREGLDAQGERVVQAELDRRGTTTTVRRSGNGLQVRWQQASWPHVSVVIPTRHNRTMLSRCLPGLARTDYPSFDVRVIDNGGRSEENERWYAGNAAGLDLHVQWWDEAPFNYSRVNNVAARATSGEVLVFLNDDTEVLDPAWMKELVGWASRPEIGCAGLQLTGPDGELQFGGTILGMGGFADHLFQGMRPGSASMLGPTDRYRNVLAVTGACLGVRREVFEQLGGFDERFVLCGSDVALGLDARLAGLRNVCSPFSGLRHLESATRGTTVPVEDFFASYWKYSTWVLGGDPYFSPNLSLGRREPSLRSEHEPTPQARISPAIGRNLTVFRQRNDEAESRMLADQCRIDEADVAAVEALHRGNADPFDVRTINWYIPDIDSPFYGGINTALRMADYLAREHGVENRFVVWGNPPDYFIRSALAAAFPSLASAEIYFYDGGLDGSLQDVPPSDVSIATLWVTAYAVAKAPRTRRKMYLVQDFEPMFYPASTLYALTEETYRLGLYALCNTENLLRIYSEEYGGSGTSFTPAVDPNVFHARWRSERDPDDPVTVFLYARPGHWRNCWELASLALEELKDRHGDGVRIITAGSWAEGSVRPGTLRSLGLLDYRATGDLYRGVDVGLALTVSKHPSYLPLELMACGVPVVAFDNPWGHWILKDGQNSLLAQRTVASLVDKLDRLVSDAALRKEMGARALGDIAAAHSSWDAAFSGLHAYMSNPEGR